MATIDEVRLYAEQLEERIKALEDKKQEPILETKQKEFLPFYEVLKVNKLFANLPVYTVARTDTPQQGEIWLTDISGTRKINAHISGTTYSATIT
jgi:hypothetical protein